MSAHKDTAAEVIHVGMIIKGGWLVDQIIKVNYPRKVKIHAYRLRPSKGVEIETRTYSLGPRDLLPVTVKSLDRSRPIE